MATVLQRLKGLKKEKFLDDYIRDLGAVGQFELDEAQKVVDSIMIRESDIDWFETLRNKIVDGFVENEKQGEDSEESFKEYYMDFFTTVGEMDATFSDGEYSKWGKAGKYGNQEFILDEDEAERIAMEIVKERLKETPEEFERDWLIDLINEDAYFDKSSKDIKNWVKDSPESYTTFIDGEEPKGEDGAYSEEQINKMAEGYLEDKKSKGLLEWLIGDLGYTGKKLYDQIFSYLDLDEVAQDAVDTDGWAHFLSRYDGNYEDGEHDVVFFRSG